MVEASPDLVYPGRRLGRRPAKNAAALMLADFITAPSHPAYVDHFNKVTAWGLYNNDKVGICGPTSVGNSRRLITAAEGQQVNPPQTDVDDLYRRSGNPGYTGNPDNPGEDNGVDMQAMCEAMLSGGFGGVKPLGFAKVNVGDLAEIDAAQDIFGFLLYGATLQVAQQSQTNNRLWDYLQSGVWGGHAFLGGRYKEDPSTTVERRGAITWAEIVDFTDSFEQHQLDEAWIVIWPEVWDNPVFDKNFDKAGFAKAYQDITGKQFPAPVPTPTPTPPAPTPTPQPTPTPPVPTPPAPTPGPGGAPFQLGITSDAVVEHIRTSAAKAGLTTDEWATAHFKHYFKV